MWKFCPAIVAGNAFILKPSERDPSVPMALAELMLEVGLPEGILQVVNGDKEVVDAILIMKRYKLLDLLVAHQSPNTFTQKVVPMERECNVLQEQKITC